MGGKTTTSTNKVTIPKDVLDRYNAINAQAAQVAQNPFQQYGTKPEDFVAQFNEQQLKGVEGINTVAGMGPVYENVDKYLNPYIKNVADTTRAQIEQANEQAQSGALGTAIQSNAFGGDRAGVAAANLAGQQNLAMGSTMANIYNQGYTQAVDTSMNDRNSLLGVAGAQLGAGTQMQQTTQAGIDALINQFQQEQGYPFQVAQFLANIAMGTGALSGSTTTSTQIAPFFSDRRLKHDIKKIGEADNGLPIYTFKYKGDEHHQTHVGFMADEVEKKNPEAVGLDPSGYKTVDYNKATESMGGAVKAFADGGVAGPYGSKVGQGVGVGSYVPQAYLPVGELMMADPDVSTAHQQNALDTLNSMASAGKSVSEIRDLLNKKAYGGVAGGYAEGGGVQPQVHNDYLSSTLAAQEANKDKPELKTAQPSEAPESPFSQILKLATTVIPMMNTGGVAAGRHGYALDGAVEERLRDAMRKAAAAENDMRLTRDEIPAVQNLGDLPDAKVVAAEAPTGVSPSGYVGPKTRGEGYIGPNSRSEAASYYLGFNKPTYQQIDDVSLSQGIDTPIEYLMPPRPTAVAAEAPTGVVPDAENDMTVPEWLSTFRLNERVPAGMAAIANLLSVPVAGAVGIGAGLVGAPEFGNAAMNFAGDRYNDYVDANTAALGTDSQIAEMYRRNAAENLVAENDAANRAIAEAPLTVDQRPKPRPVVGGVVPERYIGPNSRAEAADYYLGLNKPTDDQLLDVLISQGLTEPGDNLLPPAPTGVVPVSAPVDGQMRPKPRPEGLGAATAPVVPAKPAADTRRKIASVIGSGDGFTDVVYTDGTKDRITGNLNFRNNNPGNMEYGDLAKKYGAVGTDGRFAVFPDYETGRKAQEALLFNSGVYEGKTIGSAIAKYAPFGDGNNDPVAYANNVAAALGVPVDTPLSALNPEQRNAMLTAMEKQEGGGGLSTFSTTPLGADGSPVPLRGGVAGGDRPIGGVKPYEDRNALGKIIYDEDGKLNKNAMLSLFAGLGDMLTSQSPFLLPSIGAGVAGAARTYMAREGQLADIAKTQAETNRTNIIAASERFFDVGGQPMVTLPSGQPVSYWDLMDSPELQAQFAPGEVEAISQLVKAKGYTEGQDPADLGVAVNQGVMDQSISQDREAVQRPGGMEALKNNPVLLSDLSDKSVNASSEKPNTIEMFDVVSQGAADGNFGFGGNFYANNISPIISRSAQIFGIPLNEDGSLAAEAKAQILGKLSTVNANSTIDEQRAASVFKAWMDVSPNLDMNKDAAAVITATLMMSNQNAIDEEKFVRRYVNSDTRALASSGRTAYNQTYGALRQTEKENLANLIKMSGDESVRTFMEEARQGVISKEEAQQVLSAILGGTASPLLYRYFVME